ncbi:major facilitator superfamily MFS_1, partial [mine drainage metagenome]
MRWHLGESPRWLMIHGHEEEAEKAVRQAEACARQRFAHPLPEPEPRLNRSEPRGYPTSSLLHPPYRRRVLLLIALWFFYYIGNYGWLEMLPTLLRQISYSLASSLTYLIVSGVGFVAGALLSIWLNDRIERHRT